MKTNVRKLIATVLVMLAVACFGTLGAFAAGEDDTAAVAETTAVTETDETSAKILTDGVLLFRKNI